MSGRLFRIVPSPIYISTDEQAQDLLHMSLRKIKEEPKDLIGFDTETNGKKIPFKVGNRYPLDWMSDTVTLWSLSFRYRGEAMRFCIKGEYLQYFSSLLENPNAWLAGWNLKYDAHVCYNSGINIWNSNAIDGLALAGLHDENKKQRGLKVCAKDWVGLSMTKYEDLFPNRDKLGRKIKEYEISLLELIEQGFVDKVVDYASFDAYCHLMTVEWVIERLKNTPIHADYSLWDYYLNMEKDMTEVLWRMERRGMPLDLDYLKAQIPPIDQEALSIEKEVNNLAGQPISVTSPQQLVSFFFGDKESGGQGLTPIKLTKGGKASVDKDVLDLLDSSGIEIAKKIIRHRHITKIKSTYLTTLIDLAEYYKDSRIHPNINQFGAACMPAGELVLTNRGYLPVEKVRKGDLVLSHTGHGRAVRSVGVNGVQPIVRIELTNGLSLRTTYDHLYRTSVEEWARPDELKPGDGIRVHSDIETWAPVKGWEDYSVSSWGRIWNNKTNRQVTQRPKNKWGHLKVTLRKNGSRKRGDKLRDLPVHRLVALAFIDNFEDGPLVRHKNGIPWDNTRNNLCWGTCQENNLDTQQHGTLLKRFLGKTKITEREVGLIRSTPRTYGSDTKLAHQLGISREYVRDIRTGKTWGPRTSPDLKSRFYTAFVKHTVIEPPQTTYGLIVEVDCSHVTGGIVTHNTGRFSTDAPNSQNMPRADTDEFGIRKAFIAPPGHKLILADYCQIEMRVVAHLANDKHMLQAILEGKDLHSFTVSRMVPNVTYEEVATAKKVKSKEELTDRQAWLLQLRQNNKSIGFGIIYGAGPPRIAESIEIPEEDVQKRIERLTREELTASASEVRKGRTLSGRMSRAIKNNPLLTPEKALVLVARQSIASEKIQAYFDTFPDVHRYIKRVPEMCLENMEWTESLYGEARKPRSRPTDRNNQPIEDGLEYDWDMDYWIPGQKEKLTRTGHPRKFGYIKTFCGRYRRLEDIDHTNYAYKTEANRQATNCTVQGTAADIIKGAMLRIERNPELNFMGVQLLNQVHDELILQVPTENAESALSIVIECMEHPFAKGVNPLVVPIPADAKISDRWSEK